MSLPICTIHGDWSHTYRCCPTCEAAKPIATSEEKLRVAVEALEYYCCADHYEERITLAGTRQPGVLTEGGQIARVALAKIKGEA